ncbi:MAG: N-acetylmuramoyl-L-alanine amidase [Planctomycetota bacterium]|jgi:hypothetical protein
MARKTGLDGARKRLISGSESEKQSAFFECFFGSWVLRALSEARGVEDLIRTVELLHNDTVQSLARRFCKDGMAWEALRASLLWCLAVVESEVAARIAAYENASVEEVVEFLRDDAVLYVGDAFGLNMRHSEATLHLMLLRMKSLFDAKAIDDQADIGAAREVGRRREAESWTGAALHKMPSSHDLPSATRRQVHAPLERPRPGQRGVHAKLALTGIEGLAVLHLNQVDFDGPASFRSGIPSGIYPDLLAMGCIHFDSSYLASCERAYDSARRQHPRIANRVILWRLDNVCLPSVSGGSAAVAIALALECLEEGREFPADCVFSVGIEDSVSGSLGAVRHAVAKWEICRRAGVSALVLHADNAAEVKRQRGDAAGLDGTCHAEGVRDMLRARKKCRLHSHGRNVNQRAADSHMGRRPFALFRRFTSFTPVTPWVLGMAVMLFLALTVSGFHGRSEIREIDSLPGTVAAGASYRVTVNPEAPIDSTAGCVVEAGGSLELVGHGEIRFAAGTGIVAYGKISVTGESEDKRICLTAMDPEQAFAGIAMMDDGASYSRLDNVIIEHGVGRPSYLHGKWSDRREEEPAPAPLTLASLTKRPGALHRGGAVLVAHCSNVIFRNVDFLNNRAAAGGAIALYDAKWTEFYNCRIEGNTAGGTENSPGGGLFAGARSIGTKLHDCVVRNNSAADTYSCGGGVYIGNRSYCDMRKTLIKGNSAGHVGGGVYILDSEVEFEEGTKRWFEPLLSKIRMCSFRNNMANAGGRSTFHGWGGELFVDDNAIVELHGATEITHHLSSQPPVVSLLAFDEPWLLLDVDTVFDAPSAPVYFAVIDHVGGVFEMVEPAYYAGKPIQRLRENLAPIQELPLARGFEGAGFGRAIDTIVLHHISARNWNSANDRAVNDKTRAAYYEKHPQLKKVADQSAQSLPGSAAKDELAYCHEAIVALLDAYDVASHYMIQRDGTVYRLVDESYIAYHAGPGRMPEQFGDDRTGLNDFSLGIELVSTGEDADESPAYTEQQYAALRRLIADILGRHDIRYIVGHDEVAGDRGHDPGSGFDWSRVRDSKTGRPLPGLSSIMPYREIGSRVEWYQDALKNAAGRDHRAPGVLHAAVLRAEDLVIEGGPPA